jgi:alpha-beta hydrolase superfamily lysophospholipase
MDKPTILIVPGGFTLPELYSDVISHVASEGYSVQALHLPSIGYKTAAFIASEISSHAKKAKTSYSSPTLTAVYLQQKAPKDLAKWTDGYRASQEV